MDENDILEHFGVIGMKWGKRRSKNDSSDYTTSRQLKKKKIREMSNEEMQTVAKRIELEKRYKALNPSTIQKGTKTVDSVLTSVGKLTAAATAITALVTTGKKIFELVKKAKG